MSPPMKTGLATRVAATASSMRCRAAGKPFYAACETFKIYSYKSSGER